MELIDTIDGMTSADYKERFKAEYQQVKIRYNKLHKTIADSKSNKLSFKLESPIELLEQQYLAMYRYLSILEQRAICEGINLD